MTLIPLDGVAPDQRASIEAFRSAGGRSFQDAPTVADARDGYVASSQANGLPPAPVAHVEDVRIGAGSESFRVRVYDPREGEARGGADAVVAFFHAGGWTIGGLETHDAVCRAIANQLGLPVVAVDYRLGPEHRFPAAHVDAVRSIEWIRDEAAARGWDAQRIAMVGDSAGGGLAAMLSSVPEAAVEGTRVVAQVLLYPVLDLSAEAPSYARVDAGAGVPLTAVTMRWFAENYVAAADDVFDPRLSPLRFARAAAANDAGLASAAQPPAFVLSLGLDPLSDEAIEYAGLLALVGTHVEHLHLPRNAHGLCTSAGKVASGRRVIERTGEFIAERLADLEAEERLRG